MLAKQICYKLCVLIHRHHCIPAQAAGLAVQLADAKEQLIWAREKLEALEPDHAATKLAFQTTEMECQGLKDALRAAQAREDTLRDDAANAAHRIGALEHQARVVAGFGMYLNSAFWYAVVVHMFSSVRCEGR